MDIQKVLESFFNITVWKDGDEQSLHKPLLILLMLKRISMGFPRLVLFCDIENDLESYLHDFGPKRWKLHPEYSFWYMRNENFWELRNTRQLDTNRVLSPSKKALRNAGVLGGFTEIMYEHLMRDQARINSIARSIITHFFDESVRNDIQERLGFNTLDKNITTMEMSINSLREDKPLSDPAYIVLKSAGKPLSNNEFCQHAIDMKLSNPTDENPLTPAYYQMRRNHKLLGKQSLYVHNKDGTWGLSEWRIENPDKNTHIPIFYEIVSTAIDILSSTCKRMNGPDIAELLPNVPKYNKFRKKPKLLNYALTLEIMQMERPRLFSEDQNTWELPNQKNRRCPSLYFQDGNWLNLVPKHARFNSIVDAVVFILEQQKSFLHYLEIGRRILSQGLIQTRSASLMQGYYIIAIERSLNNKVGFREVSPGVWGLYSFKMASYSAIIPEVLFGILHRSKKYMYVSEILDEILRIPFFQDIKIRKLNRIFQQSMDTYVESHGLSRFLRNGRLVWEINPEYYNIHLQHKRSRKVNSQVCKEKLTILDAAFVVLSESKSKMHYKTICKEILNRGLTNIENLSKRSLYTSLYLDCKQVSSSRFKQIGNGYWDLANRKEESNSPLNISTTERVKSQVKQAKGSTKYAENIGGSDTYSGNIPTTPEDLMRSLDIEIDD